MSALANTSLLALQSSSLIKDNSLNNLLLNPIGYNIQVSQFTPFTSFQSYYSWRAVTAGDFSVAIRNDYTLWVWGNNTYGQLGLGTVAASRSSPVQLGTTLTNSNAYSYFFNSSAYLTTATSSLLTQGTGSFTIECWVNPTTSSAISIIDNRPNSANGFYLAFGIGTGTTAGTLNVYVNSVNIITATIANTPLNVWTHVAYVRSGTTGYIFANGMLVGTGTDSSNYIETKFQLAYGNANIGYISNFRYTKGQALFTGTTIGTTYFTPSNTPLTTSTIGATGSNIGSLITGTVQLLTCQSASIVDNSINQFSLSSTNGPVYPTTVTPFNSFQSNMSWSLISAGQSHTIALRTDGMLFSWGYNLDGELGDGTIISRSSPVQIGANSWTSISAGAYHNLALTNNGTLYAWGLNSGGQLGNTGTTNLTVPTKIGSANWNQIAAGQSHSMALNSNNILYTWGYNASGQLGNITTTNASTPAVNGTPYQTNYQSPVFIQNSIAQISGGFNAVAALTSGLDSYMYMWGYNTYGQLGAFNTNAYSVPVGVATESAQRSSPVQIGARNAWTKIYAGNSNTVAIDSSNALWVFGLNNNGQVGDGTTFNRFAPFNIQGSWTAAAPSLTGNHVMALRNDKTLWGWGQNNFKQLGDNTTINRSQPVIVGRTSFWNAVSTGQSHTIALNNNASLVVWGGNSYGQLGLAPFAFSWSQIGGSAAIRSDGSLFTWGYNGFGQLGLGDTANRSSPIAVGSDSWLQVASGDHTIAIKADRTMWGWGNNSTGQLGNSNTTLFSSPVQINSQFWNSVTIGRSHTLAVRSDNTLWGWGFNNAGQLGDGTIVAKSSPVLIGTGVTNSNAYSVLFNGTTDALTWPSLNTVRFGTGNFTVETWLYLTVAQTTPQTIIDARDSTHPTGWSLILAGTQSGTVSVSFNSGQNTLTVTTSNTNLLYVGMIITSGTFINVPATITAINYQTGVLTINTTTTATSSTSLIVNGGLIFISGGATVVSDISYSDIAVNTWYHIAYVKSSNTGRLFLNGSVVGTGVDNNDYGIIGTTGYIGRAYDGSNYLRGYVSNLRINSTTAIYTAPFTPSTVPLSAIAGTSLLIAQNLSFVDNSNIQSTITPLGFTKTTVFTPFASLIQSGPVNKVAAGSSHSVVLLANNMLMAWGANASGQLGDNSITARSVPSQIGTSSWVAVAAGVSTSAAIRSDGKLFTWGSNTNGELGDTTTINRSSPVQIGSLNWSSITMSNRGDGGVTTAAIRYDNTLWAWGYNIQGQLGDTTVTSKSSPVQVGISAWTQVAYVTGTYNSVNDYAAFGINASGLMYAWGYNTYGQLGLNNASTASSSPVQIGTSYASIVEVPTIIDTNSWTQISAGASHSMAIRNNTLYGWGYNVQGQLGVNTVANESNPVAVQIINSTVTSVSAGADFTVGLTNQGYITGFGKNDYGQLGTNDITYRSNPVQLAAVQGNYAPNYSSPVQIGTSSWSVVSAGWSHNIAIRADGALFTWGTNENYNLGDTTTTVRSSPVQIGTTTTSVGTAYSWNVVSAGRYHSVAIRSDRTLWGWGLNTSGQLGNYNVATVSSPVLIGQNFYYGTYYGPNYYQDVKAGTNHTIALADNNLVWAWGDNTYGEVGSNTIWNTSSPVQISTSPYRVISAGFNTSGGIDYAGGLYAWGLNTVGQAGNNNTNYSWKQLSNGDQHSMALRSDGSLWTWGSNSWGQLGTNRFTVNMSSPVQLGTSSWNYVSAGNSHSAAIRADGALFTWGGNSWGQLGTNSTYLALFSPLQIGTSSWISVSAGGNHTVAVRNDYTMWAWGMNTSGQLGDTTGISRSSPVQVSANNTSIIDTSINGWQATNVSGVTIITSTPFANSGTTGYSLSFNGSSYLQFPVLTTSALLTANFTIECWIYPTVTTQCTILTIGNEATGRINFATVTGNLVYNIFGSSAVTLATSVITQNAWQHVAIVRNGTTITGYVNGVAGSTPATGVSGTLGNSNGTYVMGASTGAQGTGYISNLRFTNYTIIYYSAFTTPTTPLVASINATLLLQQSNPTPISWNIVSAGASHSLALSTTNLMFGWGNNLYGQAGVQLNGGWRKASSRGNQTFAVFPVAGIKSNGKLFTWGSNANGELGQNDLVHRSSPTQLGSYSWNQVVASTAILAIRGDGTLWAWGVNTQGQLGTGDTYSRSSPVQIGTSSWSAIDTSDSNSVAVRSDGALFTWGNNQYGQIGDGSTNTRYSPTQVIANTISGNATAYAVYFSGNNADYLSLASNTNYALSTSTNYTIESWIYFTQFSASTNYGFFQTTNSTTTGAGCFWFGYVGGTANISGITVGQIGVSTYTITAYCPAFAINTWYHVAAVRNSGLVSIYLNGVALSITAVNNTSGVYTTTSNAQNNIAFTQAGILVGFVIGYTSMPGYISNLRYNTTTAVYTGNFTPTGPLAATQSAGTTNINAISGGTQLLTCQSSTIIDNALSATITVAGATQVGYVTPFSAYATPMSWTKVASNQFNTYAIRSDGALFAWGYNTDGQLGVNDVIRRYIPKQVGTSSWTSVYTTYAAVYAIRADGLLFAWGYNGRGELGDNTVAARSSPVQITTNSWSMISASLGISPNIIGTTVTGVMYQWGYNGNGTFGNSTTSVSNTSSPALVAGSANITNSSGLYSWTFVSAGLNAHWINNLGLMVSSGYNGFGSLGDNTVTQRTSPILVGTNLETNIVSPIQIGTSSYSLISAGYYHSTAIRTDGALFAWGDNYFGEIGVPIRATVVNAGYNTTSIIRPDGGLMTWGYNTNGQLGIFDTVNRSSPTQLGSFNSSPTTVASQAIGVAQYIWNSVVNANTHSLAIRNDGTLWAWGDNTYGQLGQNNVVAYSSPVQVGWNNNWSQVFVGFQTFTSYAIRNDGTLWGWGNGAANLLSSGGVANASSPVQIDSSNTYASLSVGNSFVIGKRTNGAMVGWGLNASGQLGQNNLTSPITSPTLIANATGTSWNAVSAGLNFAYAIRGSDSSLWAWGVNAQGQLGNGTVTATSSPVAVSNNIILSNSNAYSVGVNGTDYMIVYPTNNNFVFGTGDFTFEGWIYSNVASASNYVFDMRPVGSIQGFYPMIYLNAGVITYYVNSAAAITGGTIAALTWYHVGLARINGVTRMFLNGTQTGSNYTDTNNYILPTWFVLGGNANTLNANQWNGNLSNFRFIKGQGLFSAGFTPSTVPLTNNTVGATGAGAAASITGTVALLTFQNTVQPFTFNANQTTTPGYTQSTLQNTIVDNSGNNVKIVVYGTYHNSSVNTPFTGSKVAASWSQISAGQSNVVGLLTNNTLWVWGDNSNGQFGDNTVTAKSSPVQIGLSSWSQISSGYFNTVAVDPNNLVWVWGYNAYGTNGANIITNYSNPVQIGITTNGAYVQPTQVGNGSWSQVAAGQNFTVATTSTNKLFTWGWNSYSQIGTYDIASRSSPVFQGTNSYTLVAAGGFHGTAFGVGTGGIPPTLFSWGFNQYGAVGDNSVIPRSYMVQVAVTTVSSSAPALVSAGVSPAGFYSSSPVQVGTSSWINVSAGGAHTVGTTSNGVFAWGYNRFGQDGDATVINKSSPVQISTSSFTNISAGSNHTIMTRSDGISITFGNNNNGQLGDGT